MKVESLKIAAVAYQANIGVGIDGFHPKIPLDLQNEKVADCILS